MRIRKYLFILLIILPGAFASSSKSICLKQVEEYLKGFDNNTVQKLIELQTAITMHRFAYATLTAESKSNLSPAHTREFEARIWPLLIKRNEEQAINPQLKLAFEKFENSKKSLTHEDMKLLGMELKGIMDENGNSLLGNIPKSLKLSNSDLKVMSIWKEINQSGNSWDFGNIRKIINGSYKVKGIVDSQQGIIANKLKLTSTIEHYQKDLLEILESKPFYLDVSCFEKLGISSTNTCKSGTDLVAASSLVDIINLNDGLLGKLYDRDWTGLKQNLKNSKRKWLKWVKPKSNKKIETSSPFLVNGKRDFDNPYTIIKNAMPNIETNLNDYSKEFANDWANSILLSEKNGSFAHNGKVYNTNDGSEIVVDKNWFSYSEFADDKLKAKAYSATLNNKISFIHNGDLYETSFSFLDGKRKIRKISKGTIDNKIKESLGNDYFISLEGQKGKISPLQIREFKTNLVNAINNKQNYFLSGGKQYLTRTGKSPKDKYSDMTHGEEKQRYDSFHTFSNIDTIKQFHASEDIRNCEQYVLIDKQQEKIKIMNIDGSINRSTSLSGVKELDDKIGGLSAGIYKISQKNLLVSIGHEKTGGGYEKDQSDTFKRKGFLDVLAKYPLNNCPLYILPNEEHIKFKINNEKIVMTTDKYLGSKGEMGNNISFDEFNKYRFSPKTIEYKPMDWKFTDEAFDDKRRKNSLGLKVTLGGVVPTYTISKSPINEKTRQYLNALKDEKEHLMKLYGLTSDEYNDLAKIAFGILGNEASFFHSPELAVKEFCQECVTEAKGVESTLKILKKVDNPAEFAYAYYDIKNLKAPINSRGPTQIKYLASKMSNDPRYDHISKENLMIPANAAVATLGQLAEIKRQMKNIERNFPLGQKINSTNRHDYMLYLYMGSKGQLKAKDIEDKSKSATPEKNLYIQSVKKYMELLEIRNLD